MDNLEKEKAILDRIIEIDSILNPKQTLAGPKVVLNPSLEQEMEDYIILAKYTIASPDRIEKFIIQLIYLLYKKK
jgi:hypothetical protein